MAEALPVLDIGAFAAGADPGAAAEFVADLRRTCHEIGFFYLAGHGVDPALNARLLDAARAFFALPEQDRLAIENIHSPQFRGYTRVGEEHTNGRRDWRDQLDISHELEPQWTPGAPDWLRLRGPNLWPAALPELRTVVLEWMAALEGVGRTLLRAVAMALGQPPGHFDATVSPRPEVLVKIIRYPGGDDDGQGVGSHRDTGFLTFLLQDGTGGLQVARPVGFVDVPAIEGTFVVNLGEMLQLASHGYLKATVHRVVRPPAGVERVSVPYFFNPKLEATLAPVPLPPALAAEAPGGESTDASNPILANYGANSMKVRLRAHPNVAARHHADLLR